MPVSLWNWPIQQKPELMTRVHGQIGDFGDPESAESPRPSLGANDTSLLLAGDGAVQLWRLTKDRRPVGVRLPVFGVPRFSRDGKHVVVARRDSVSSYRANLDELLDIASRAAGRNFTMVEWRRFFGDAPYQRTFASLPMDSSAIKATIDDAVDAYSRGDQRGAKESFQRAAGWAIEAGDGRSANAVAWAAGIRGIPLLEAAEYAARDTPDDGWTRDTLAVVLALSGDLQRAAEELESVLAWAGAHGVPEKEVVRRRRWLSELRQGRSPFTPAELALLAEP